MPVAQTLLVEFEREAAITRQLLALVPEERADWRPHEKSMSLGRLAAHLSELPFWAVMTITRTELDMRGDGDHDEPRKFDSTANLLHVFDENVRNAHKMLELAADDDFDVPWTLKNGDDIIFSMPRINVLRTWVINHLVHHRGQLSVYLRMLDVPLPSIYGPTADLVA
jgi:uncharacterized damage-inducible protein DinB